MNTEIMFSNQDPNIVLLLDFTKQCKRVFFKEIKMVTLVYNNVSDRNGRSLGGILSCIFHYRVYSFS